MAPTNPPQELVPPGPLFRDPLYLALYEAAKEAQSQAEDAWDRLLVAQAEARDAKIRANMAHIRAGMATTAFFSLSGALNDAARAPSSSASPSPAAVVPSAPPPVGP